MFLLSQENKDKIIINLIENSKNYDWLKEKLKNKYLFSNEMLKIIKKIPSKEINDLLKQNYSF